MKKKNIVTVQIRKNKCFRIRKKMFGIAAKPRLSIFRSNKEIYAQLIDDENMKTITSFSTKDKKFIGNGTKSEKAKIVGKAIGELALSKGIETCVFDRGGYLYHGRVKSLAEGAREAGLKF